MTERELRSALRQAAEVDPAARERSWRVVQAAYRPSPPRVARRRWSVSLVAAVAFALAAVGAAAATAPRSEVGRWVRSVFGAGEPHARRALVRLPGGGRLLVETNGRTWVVSSDGAKRDLGSYSGASWSPHGNFVVAWRAGVLTAVDPRGRPRWSLARPGRISAARWAPVDGFRIAYLADGDLRIVNGDGSGDHRYAAARQDVAPAWRPDAGHVVAFVDARQRVDVVAVDSRRLLWRSRRLRGVLQLTWSAGGDRLLAVGRRRLLLFDGAGKPRASRRLAAGFTSQAAVWAPRGHDVVAVRHSRDLDRSELVLLDAARGLRERLLFTGPGRFGDVQWSPHGGSLLLPWPAADQWLFLSPGQRLGKLTAFANIAAQFAPGTARPEFPTAVQWCCQVSPAEAP